MFYDGDINTLMDFNGDCSHWKIKDPSQAEIPAIPCLACHKIHSPRNAPGNLGLMDSLRNPPKTSFYSRAERKHFRTDNLTPIEMYLGSKKLETSKDPNTLFASNVILPIGSAKRVLATTALPLETTRGSAA